MLSYVKVLKPKAKLLLCLELENIFICAWFDPWNISLYYIYIYIYIYIYTDSTQKILNFFKDASDVRMNIY